MKHHYVPECYLQGFAKPNGDLYALDINLVKQGKKLYPSLRNKTNICYFEDYYDITSDSVGANALKISQYDTLYVETEVLGKKEFKFKNVRDRLISCVNVTLDDFRFMSDFIYQLKKRNPFFLKTYLQPQHKELINGAFQNTMQKMESEGKYSHLSAEIKQQKAAEIILKWTKDNNMPRHLQLASLIGDNDLNGLGYTSIQDNLLNAQWIIMETTEKSDILFITSDNPGFALDGSFKTYNTKFKDDFLFCLPLTSRHCLFISDKDEIAKPPLIFKVPIEPEHVMIYNLQSSALVNQHIIGPKAKELKEIADRIR